MIHIHKYKLISKKEKYDYYYGYDEIRTYKCQKCGKEKVKIKYIKENKC